MYVLSIRYRNKNIFCRLVCFAIFALPERGIRDTSKFQKENKFGGMPEWPKGSVC